MDFVELLLIDFDRLAVILSREIYQQLCVCLCVFFFENVKLASFIIAVSCPRHKQPSDNKCEE